MVISLFAKKINPGSFEILNEGEEEVMKINYEGLSMLPSLEDSRECMADTIDKIIQVPSVNRIIFYQRRNYEYGYEQAQVLREIANIYSHLNRQKKLLTNINALNYMQKSNELKFILENLIKSDPIGAYVEIKRLIREEKLFLEKSITKEEIRRSKAYLDILIYVFNLLDKSKLVKIARPYLDGFSVGNRGIYKSVFKASITPEFMITRLLEDIPLDAIEVDAYKIDEDNEVSIYKTSNDIKYLYSLNPIEYQISEEEYDLVETARQVLSEHQPKSEEFVNPERIRQTFFNIGRDLITELAEHKGIDLEYNRAKKLAEILVRYTVGFGLIEILLKDEKIQDVSINGPIGETTAFIVHQDYEECVTNIIPSKEDGQSWATKFRIISGRPLDEANPVLDTELTVPGAKARVAIISNPLNPLGLGYSFRRHRDKPWTLPLFINNGMINSLGAGLLSFLIDGNRSLLVAGTRSSGKTSFLGSIMIEIMRKYRMITVEDTLELGTEAMRKLGYNIQPMKVRAALAVAGGSEVAADEGIRTSLRMGDSSLIVGEVRSSIRGCEEVLIVEEGLTKRIQIKELEGKDISNIYVPSMAFDLKFKLCKLNAFVKHPKRNKLLEIKTRTGRRITVTPDHSLFTHKDFMIVPIECQNINSGDKIIIPEKIPIAYNNISRLNIFDMLSDENCRAVGYEENLKQIIKKIGWKKATQISNINDDVYRYLREGIQHTNIPINTYKNLITESNYGTSLETIKIKKGTSNTLNAEIQLTNDFCRFLGYYAAEGFTDKNGNVVFSNGDKVIIADIINLSKKLFNINPIVRITKGLGFSTQMKLCNKILGLLIKKLGAGRVAIEKRIPAIIFGLSEDKICEFLKGYFDGDGTQTSVKASGNRVSCSTISKGLANDIMYLLLNLGIVARVYYKKPYGIGRNTNYTIEIKQRKYVELFINKIGFKKYKKELISGSVPHSNLNTVNYDISILEQHVKLKRKFRHLRKYNSCGKEYLRKVVEESKFTTPIIKNFVNGEFFIDEVKEIKEIILEEGEHVYDLSVGPGQNFIGGFGGILLHNTEAQALYEAMRVGALANVVAGTIHGDSPYGVFDRVVNDLQVPKTSFKATDIIIIANPIRTADGLHKKRRIVSITEVRKEWEEDPLRENGFVDLMRYNPKTDQLEMTDNLINGDSDIIKSIASNVKEWAGNWDAVWDNIMLRASIKKTLVETATKIKNPLLLEAEFTIRSNDEFHRISDSVREKYEIIDTKRIYFEWNEWLKKQIKLKNSFA